LIPKKDYTQRDPIPPKEEKEEEKQSMEEESGRKESIYFIETDVISPNPNQPRKEFGEESLRELASSILEHGVLQPLIVTKIEYETPNGQGVKYQIIAGERRLKAAKIAGLPYVPAIVRKKETDQKNLELALIENIQREDLNIMERALAFKRFSEEFGLTQNEISQRVGKGRATVANVMRLLNLPQEIQDAIKNGRITEGHARAILAIEDLDQQMIFFRKIVLNNISVRDAETHARRLRRGPGSVTAIDPNTKDILTRIEEVLGTKINFSPKKEGGRLQIEFYSKEDLYRFLDKLNS